MICLSHKHYFRKRERKQKIAQTLIIYVSKKSQPILIPMYSKSEIKFEKCENNWNIF